MAFTIDLRDICNVLPCREQRRSPSNLTKHCVGHQKWVSLSMLVTYSPTSVTWFGATGVSSDVGKYWVWHEISDACHIKDVNFSWASTSIVCCFLHIPFPSARKKSLKQWDTSNAGWQWVVLPCNFAAAVRRGVIRNNSVSRPSFNKGTRLYPLVYRPSAPSLLLFFSLSPNVFLPRSVFLAFPLSVVCFLLLSLVFPTCFRFILLFGNYVDNSLLVGQIRMDAPVSTSNWKESCMDGTIWTPTIKLLTWSTHSHVTKKCEVIFKKVGRTMFKMRQNVVANLAFVSEPRARPAQIVFA